jgi:hypothetical protein
MTLIKTSPNTATNKRAWKAGDLKEDLADLEARAAVNDLDAQARLMMLKSIEARNQKPP